MELIQFSCVFGYYSVFAMYPREYLYIFTVVDIVGWVLCDCSYVCMGCTAAPPILAVWSVELLSRWHFLA